MPDLTALAEKALGVDAGSKEEFINLVVTHPDKADEIVALWQKLFPTDDWVDDLR